jgi:glycosyltransferase involved in cell wall biosynthesis
MKLSIIIPVYNTEKTLNRCINSVIKQTCEDYEIILVDDGSPDNCGIICDNWMEKDNRIFVIHQSNQGLSDARNTGLKIAKGEYVTFIDSDDAIADNTLMELMHEIIIHPEYDLLEYSVYIAYESTKQRMLILHDQLYYNVVDEYWLGNKAYTHTYAWNKIYRRSLFNNIRFPQGLKFEDAYTLPLILKECKCICTTSTGLYYYYLNTDGITNSATGYDLKQLLIAHVNTFNNIRNIATDICKLIMYYMYIVNIQCDVYEQTDSKIILPEIHIELKCILKKDVPLKFKIKAIYLNIFGLKELCKINKLLHKTRRQY